MATRKKATRRKAARKKVRRRKGPIARLEEELPKTLREYTKEVNKRLNHLEREVERGQAQARRRAARLIRQASHELGKHSGKGEKGWRGLTAPYRRDAVHLLRRLERAVAPARKKASRKKARRKKPASA